MTSIRNDAFTVGTAAVGAAGANVVYQNRKAIRKVLSPAVDTVVKAGKAVPKTYTDAFKALKKSLKTITNAEKRAELLKNFRAERTMAKAQKAKEAILKGQSAFASKEANEYFAKHGVTFPGLKDKVKGYANKAGAAIKDTAKSAWDKVAAFGKATNWKTVGKVAGVAAGIAIAIVAIKEGIKALIKD